jgi:hypothetical protein
MKGKQGTKTCPLRQNQCRKEGCEWYREESNRCCIAILAAAAANVDDDTAKNT